MKETALKRHPDEITLLLATHIFSLLPTALKTQMFNIAYQGQVVNFSILISTCHSSLSSQSFFFLFFKHNKLFLIWELMHFLIASLGTVVLTSNHPSIYSSYHLTSIYSVFMWRHWEFSSEQNKVSQVLYILVCFKVVLCNRTFCNCRWSIVTFSNMVATNHL